MKSYFWFCFKPGLIKIGFFAERDNGYNCQKEVEKGEAALGIQDHLLLSEFLKFTGLKRIFFFSALSWKINLELLFSSWEQPSNDKKGHSW